MLCATAPRQTCIRVSQAAAAPKTVVGLRALPLRRPVGARAARGSLACSRSSAICPRRDLLAQKKTLPARASRGAVVVRASSGAKIVEAESEFSLSKISFGTIGLSLGLPMLVYGFCSYFHYVPGDESFSSLVLIYGFIIALLGFALKYAELPPLECVVYSDADALRASQATDIQIQVKNDVTRFRYGDEEHLEEAIQRVFMSGRAGGVPRRNLPKLVGLEERAIDGFYALVLVFDAPKLDFEDMEKRVDKFTSFFGPGIKAQMKEVATGKVEVALVSEGKGGSGKDTRPDVMPQLMPGLEPRQQQN